jgi:hypothetical protein
MTHLLLLLLLLWYESRSQWEAVKQHMQGHGRARLSKRSNKEACSMKTQLHEAHRSMQEGVAGLPGISQVFKHGSRHGLTSTS